MSTPPPQIRRSVLLALREAAITDPPYVESTSCRVLMTRFMRHAVALTRVKHVSVSDRDDRDRFAVRGAT